MPKKERIIGISDTPTFDGPPDIANLDQVIDLQSKNYAKRIGKIYGDFQVVNVEYDFTRRRQKWTLKCLNCGDTKDTYNGRDYVKGRSKFCECHYEKMRKQREESKPKNDKKPWDDKSWIGLEINGQVIIDHENHYNMGHRFQTKCTICGKERKIQCTKFCNGNFRKCDHVIPIDYSKKDYVGKKFGNLTVLKYEERKFFVRCDCGNEKWVRPVDLIRNHAIKTCGSPNCNFHIDALKRAKNFSHYNRLKGIKFEKQYAESLRKQGLNVEETKESGDFGVDLIINEDSHKIAIQCKRYRNAIGVSAVQEVFAGGTYYGCDKFQVVSTSGYTDNAKLMADALGVELLEYSREKQTFRVHDRNVYWTINGETKTANEWCDQYGISHSAVNNRVKKGMTIEEALKTPKKQKRRELEIDGTTKFESEWCSEYGISLTLFRYRTEKCGMSAYEALTSNKKTAGRPRKNNLQMKIPNFV